MAISKTISFNHPSDGANRNFALTVEELSTSIENNTSEIKWTITISGGGGYKYDSGVKAIVNGQEVYANYTQWSSLVFPSANGSVSGTMTIKHENDGKKDISMHIEGYSYQYTTYSADGTLSLSNIPRASEITNNTSSSSRKDFGASITFTIDRKVEAFKHKLTYKIGNTTYTIGTDLGTSKAYSFPTSLISNFTSNENVEITVACDTYNGTDLIGSKTTNVYLHVPNSYIPTISLALQDVGTTPSSWGIWLKTRSKIKGTITASGVSGSTISRYSATANNQSYSTSSFTTDGISSSGNITINASVVDSRNRTASTSQTITVVDYFKPTISKFEVKRCNSDGTLNEDGTYAKAIITYSIAPCSNKNSKSLKVKDITNNNEKTITLTGYSGTITTAVFSNIATANYYNFTANIGDSFETIPYTAKISPSAKVMSFKSNKKGVSFGQTATEDGLHSYWNTTIHGDLNFTGTLKKNGSPLTFGKPTISKEFGGSTSGRYYKLFTLPVANNNGNSTTFTIQGMLGNWINEKATIELQISTRGGLKCYGSYLGSQDAFTYQEIIIYQETDNTYSTYLYVKADWTLCKLELDKQGSQGTVYSNFDNYITSPTGTVVYEMSKNNMSNLSLNSLHPIGSIYISEKNTSPASLFGGTWEKITGRFLYGVDADNKLKSTGGSSSHTHNYGVVVGGYYSNTKLAEDTDAGLVSYDSSNNVGMATIPGGTYRTNVGTTLNSAVGNGTRYTSSNYDRVITNTSYTSTIPPYYGVYFWRRTA